jgi:hypothetical protein
MTRLVATQKPEPQEYVLFQAEKVIVVRSEGVTAIPLKQFERIQRAVRRHQKALALARRKPHTEELAAGYQDWMAKHLDDPAAPAPTSK